MLQADKMKEQLITFIENLKEDKRIVSFDEAATKQAIVLRLLSILDWDTFNIDEVSPEYSVGGKKVDYSLRVGSGKKVFVEVKKTGEELENHQEQLLNYAFQEGVKLAILTNGITWWFYLPLHEGSWEQRRFYTIDVLQQETEEIVSKFIDFLSKENITSGVAIQNAETTYKSYKKQNILEETLPQAWNKIISDGDETLIEFISETTEKLCGYKPDSEMVDRFISKNKDRLLISVVPPTKIISRTIPKATRGPVSIPMNYTGKSVSAFYFRNTKYEVRTWIEMWMRLIDILRASHSIDFERVLALKGRRRPYFTRNSNELRAPQKISNTNIFVEANLSANQIVKICFDLLSVFGYSDNDLRIEAY